MKDTKGFDDCVTAHSICNADGVFDGCHMHHCIYWANYIVKYMYRTLQRQSGRHTTVIIPVRRSIHNEFWMNFHIFFSRSPLRLLRENNRKGFKSHRICPSTIGFESFFFYSKIQIIKFDDIKSHSISRHRSASIISMNMTTCIDWVNYESNAFEDKSPLAFLFTQTHHHHQLSSYGHSFILIMVVVG